MLAEADRNFSDFSDLVHVLAWSGVRTGEACGLRWDDCDPAGVLDVKRTVSHTRGRVRIGPTKSSKARRVDVPIELVARLDRRRALAEAEAALEGRDTSPWIFPDPHDLSRPLDVRFFSIKRWPRLLRAAGLRYLPPHALRHTFASLLLAAGTPIHHVRELLGHSSIVVTVDLYGHVVPGANRSAVERLAGATGPLRGLDATISGPAGSDYPETVPTSLVRG